MESGTVGSAEPSWSNVSGFSLVASSSNVHAGSKSGVINNTSGTNSLDGQSVSVVAGQVYCIEGWIQTSALPTNAGHGGFLQVAFASGPTSFPMNIAATATGGVQSSTVLPNWMEC
jgi:hypothetical protein